MRLIAERRMPVFGIGVGMQLINVQQGGNLFLHIPEDLPDALPHKDPHDPGHRHGLEVLPGSLMERVYGDGEIRVNSMHHMAIDEVALGFCRHRTLPRRRRRSDRKPDRRLVRSWHSVPPGSQFGFGAGSEDFRRVSRGYPTLDPCAANGCLRFARAGDSNGLQQRATAGGCGAQYGREVPPVRSHHARGPGWRISPCQLCCSVAPINAG